MEAPEGSPTQRSYDAIRRVERPIRGVWPAGGRFFVPPPVLFLVIVVATVLAFVVTYARWRSNYAGGY